MEPKGQWLTSSHLRSASSAMFFASLSCNSWISIFSSSFMALFSITFMPLRSRETGTIQQGRQDKRMLFAFVSDAKNPFSLLFFSHLLNIQINSIFPSRFSPFTLIRILLGLLQFLQSSSQSLLSAVQLLLHQLDPAVQRCHFGLRLEDQEGKETRERAKVRGERGRILLPQEERHCSGWPRQAIENN